MGNTFAFIRGSKEESPSEMGGWREGEGGVAGINCAGEDAPCSSPLDLHVAAPQSVGNDVVAKATASGGEVVSMEVERRIEESKSHWSEVTEFDCGSDDEDVEADNWEVLKDALLSHPTWGRSFICMFGYDLAGWRSAGSLEIGEKFAEGGQAELFHAKIVWTDPCNNEWDKEYGREWVVKVFKKGTPLRHLKSQWPHGMLQFRAEEAENWKSPTPNLHQRFYSVVECGTLLEDGRFAFLMEKEHLDLRMQIDHEMKTPSTKNCGPFSKEVVEEMMFEVALGMSWLHNRDIVHRDLKASNVLIRAHDGRYMQGFVADYECSIGVVGTGFFRAPEILKACKDRSVYRRHDLFTKSSDVYSYGMTCYEILTGKLPFDGHLVNDYIDCVIDGERPKLPNYVESWIQKLVRDCWQYDPLVRPSFEDVVNTILDNSVQIRKLVENGSYKVDQMDWINWRSLARST